MSRLHRLGKCWKKAEEPEQEAADPADKKLERKRVVVRPGVCVAYRLDVKAKKMIRLFRKELVIDKLKRRWHLELLKKSNYHFKTM